MDKPQANQLASAQQLIADTPFAHWLGAQVTEEGSDVLIHVPFNEMLVGNSRIRAIHGGIMASILEIAAAATLVAHDPAAARLRPISMQTNFLKSTKDTDTWARGIIRKIGRRIDTIEAIAWQLDPQKPVAIAVCDFARTEVKDKSQ